MTKKAYCFKFKNLLFGTTGIVNNINRENYVYSGYGITFHGAGWWSFDNYTSRNVIIFGVDNSSSSHAGNLKKSFFILVKVQVLELIEALIHQRRNYYQFY